jgi:O-antigen/teichoic acid export membrane protein
MVSALFKRSGGFFFGLTASRLITTIVYILLARHFAPHIFGQLILYATLLSIATYFADLGLNQWYQKEVERAEPKQTFHKVLSARTYSLLITIAIFSVFFYFIPSFNFAIQVLFLINIVPEAYSSIIDGYYLVEKKPIKISIKNGVRALFLLMAVLFVKDLTFTQTVLAFLLGSFASFLWIFPWKMLNQFHLNTIKKSVSVMKGSSPYAFLIITSFAYARGDQLAIRYLLSDAALGFYGSAYRYLESLSLIPAALSQNLFPLSAQKKGISASQLSRITLVMSVLGACLACALFFFAHFLIIDLLGPQYQPAVVVTQIFSLVLFLFFVNSPLSTVVQSSNLIKQFLPFGVINTVANIGLNILFVPRYGITAAAYVMLFTEITGLFINLIFIQKIYKKT